MVTHKILWITQYETIRDGVKVAFGGCGGGWRWGVVMHGDFGERRLGFTFGMEG